MVVLDLDLVPASLLLYILMVVLGLNLVPAGINFDGSVRFRFGASHQPNCMTLVIFLHFVGSFFPFYFFSGEIFILIPL